MSPVLHFVHFCVSVVNDDKQCRHEPIGFFQLSAKANHANEREAQSGIVKDVPLPRWLNFFLCLPKDFCGGQNSELSETLDFFIDWKNKRLMSAVSNGLAYVVSFYS